MDSTAQMADLLVSRALHALEENNTVLSASTAAEIDRFLRLNETKLDASGYTYLVEDLYSARNRLTGDQPGTADAPNRYTTAAAGKKSPLLEGAKAGVLNVVQRLNYWLGGKKPDGDPPGDDPVKKLVKYAAIGLAVYVAVEVMKTARAFKS